MKKESTRTQKLIVLFCLFVVLMNFPFLQLFNLPVLVGGIPLLWVYIFSLWILMIVLVALLSGRRTTKNRDKNA